MSHLLLLLAVVPLSCFYLTKQYKPQLTWLLTGVSFGMVVAPLSLALMKYTYIPVVGKLLGFIGLSFNLIHGSLGYFMVVGIGIQEPGVVLSALELTTINLVNAVIWSVYYGIVGYHCDRKGAAADEQLVFEGYKQKVAL